MKKEDQEKAKHVQSHKKEKLNTQPAKPAAAAARYIKNKFNC